MSNRKALLIKASFATLMALGALTRPVDAHTVAIGYIVISPGDVDVWFGSYHPFAQAPTTEGQALLTLPDLSQISVPFTLTSPTTPVGLVAGVNTQISQTHLNPATNLPYLLTDLTSWEGAPFTNLTQVGTYTVDLDPAFPPQSQKWDNDLGGPITFTINPNVSGLQIPTAGLTTNQKGVLQGINYSMANGGTSGSLTRLDVLLMQVAGNSAQLGRVLDQMSPLKFGNFASTTAFNNEDFETAAMDMYLENLRTGKDGSFAYGNGQIDASSLTVNDPNIDPALQMVHSRMLAWNAPSSTLTDVPSAVLGGVDMKDPKNMCCGACENNPWNVFIRGNVILAQGYSQADIPHFDDNTASVVIGGDYRFTPHLLAGATLGYAHTDATLDTSNSSATVDSYTPGIHAAFVDHGWFANLQGRYSYNSYTQARSIDFLHQVANSATDGNEGVVDLDGGYEFHSGALTYGPIAGLQYTHLTVNGYSESGTDANLRVNEDQSDSLRSRLGAELKYDFKRCGGVTLSPHLNASWVHEFMDSSRGLNSTFTNFNGGGAFVVRTQGSSDDFALVDAGLDAKVTDAVTVFADYMVLAGQDNYFGQSVQAGLKVNF